MRRVELEWYMFDIQYNSAGVELACGQHGSFEDMVVCLERSQGKGYNNDEMVNTPIRLLHESMRRVDK